MTATRGFTSDNASGVHPDVLAAIEEANRGHVRAYGDDPWTARATELIREHLGWPDAAVAFVFGGTGANVVGLQVLMRPHEAVICPASAHINVDECGAPERMTGGKLLDVPTDDGKLTAEHVSGAIFGVGVEHHSQPAVVSISQASEYGTVYRPDELRALRVVADTNGLALHIDGARLANAAATLGCSLGLAAHGADVLSLGGTKNGLLAAEAVVVRDPERARSLRWIRKQSTQLPSKMRFVAAQFIAALDGELWLRNASHANAMAAKLAEAFGGLPGVTVTQRVEANEVFAMVPPEAITALQAAAAFYVWDEPRSEIRLVTSWDTAPEDVDAFVVAASHVLGPETRH